MLISSKKFNEAKNYFIDTYDGLTITGKSTGFWKHSEGVYIDETVEYFVLVGKKTFDKKVRPKLHEELSKFKKQFKQLEILCYYHNVMST